MNDIKKGNLTAHYEGVMPWGYKLNVPTCNVYHEYYKYPIATFHSCLAVNFKSGVDWFPDDLADLVEIRKLWEIECERITSQVSSDIKKNPC